MQLGKFAEFFVTMAFVRAGLDVYTPAIDHRGIDLVVRLDAGQYLEVQVKATLNDNYVFMRKTSFPLDQHRYLAYVRFSTDTVPSLYLIPAITWLTPSSLCVSHDYDGKKSQPEYGLSVTRTNQTLLDAFRFDRIVAAVAPMQSAS
jgi:hypothetical protein